MTFMNLQNFYTARLRVSCWKLFVVLSSFWWTRGCAIWDKKGTVVVIWVSSCTGCKRGWLVDGLMRSWSCFVDILSWLELQIIVATCGKRIWVTGFTTHLRGFYKAFPLEAKYSSLLGKANRWHRAVVTKEAFPSFRHFSWALSSRLWGML